MGQHRTAHTSQSSVEPLSSSASPWLGDGETTTSSQCTTQPIENERMEAASLRCPTARAHPSQHTDTRAACELVSSTVPHRWHATQDDADTTRTMRCADLCARRTCCVRASREAFFDSAHARAGKRSKRY